MTTLRRACVLPPVQIKTENPDIVTSAAEIQEVELGCFDRFVVLAPHGLFDVLSNEDVVTIVAQLLASDDVVDPAEALIMHALEKGAKTNLTAVIMVFGTPGTASYLGSRGIAISKLCKPSSNENLKKYNGSEP